MIVATSSFAAPPRIVLAPPPPETMHSLGTDALTRLILQLCRQWQVRGAPALTPWAPPKLTTRDVWAAQRAALDTIYSPRPR